MTRALGVNDDPQLQTVSLNLMPGDRLLLCSDGLSRSLQTSEQLHGDIDQLCDQLLATSLGRDGSDNISLVLIEQTIAD